MGLQAVSNLLPVPHPELCYQFGATQKLPMAVMTLTQWMLTSLVECCRYYFQCYFIIHHTVQCGLSLLRRQRGRSPTPLVIKYTVCPSGAQLSQLVFPVLCCDWHILISALISLETPSESLRNSVSLINFPFFTFRGLLTWPTKHPSVGEDAA